MEGTVTSTTTERADVLSPRHRPDYNESERRYGAHVRELMREVLKGDIDRLDVMTKYHGESGRLSVVPVPRTVDSAELRLDRVEEILTSTVRFLYDGSDPGPVAELGDQRDGVVVEPQDYPTRFPHIVIERTDAYDVESGDPIWSGWSIHRLQNQRRNTQINRMLDAMLLGLEILNRVR